MGFGVLLEPAGDLHRTRMVNVVRRFLQPINNRFILNNLTFSFQNEHHIHCENHRLAILKGKKESDISLKPAPWNHSGLYKVQSQAENPFYRSAP